jgi:hypothetical protein
MGVLSDAAAMAGGRRATIFLTASLALVPAYFLAGAIAFLASTHATAQTESASVGEAIAEKSRALPPDAAAEERRGALREAADPKAVQRPQMNLPFAAGLAVASLVVMAALFFAQAALLQVAAGASGPAAAWAAVGARFAELSTTTAAALAVIALGTLIFFLPGLFAAFAFSLAGAVAAAEGASGSRALQRSWELVKRAWPEMLALIVGTAAVIVLLTQGLGRLLPAGPILAHALLDAAIAAAVLPLPVFASAVVYLRERSSAEGKRVEEIRQYIRRSSEPG